ncbi:hypothetical protein EVAR_37721_1 [Eumeta japonica]|uniref:Uncharacterized protein n=1 Tax=Eumeta variegata TaxID=151549 RepID=A0A4C1YQC4_EUMVA|nr:hypothetical protein EVAR_37721_1 [Eumeta japonica]
MAASSFEKNPKGCIVIWCIRTLSIVSTADGKSFKSMLLTVEELYPRREPLRLHRSLVCKRNPRGCIVIWCIRTLSIVSTAHGKSLLTVEEFNRKSEPLPLYCSQQIEGPGARARLHREVGGRRPPRSAFRRSNPFIQRNITAPISNQFRVALRAPIRLRKLMFYRVGLLPCIVLLCDL